MRVASRSPKQYRGSKWECEEKHVVQNKVVGNVHEVADEALGDDGKGKHKSKGEIQERKKERRETKGKKKEKREEARRGGKKFQRKRKEVGNTRKKERKEGRKGERKEKKDSR